MDAKPFESLPFEVFRKIFSYFDLKEIIKLRIVSRKFCVYIDNFSISSLFFSEVPRDCVFDKNRLTSGRFSQNVISSPKFDLFFRNFTPTILSALKRLRVCRLDVQGRSPAFVEALNSFAHLEDLTIIDVKNLHPQIQLKLTSLKSVHIEKLTGIERLLLDAPVLVKLKICFGNHEFALNLVCTDAIELIEADRFAFSLSEIEFANLKFLFCSRMCGISEKFLATSHRLEVIHLNGDSTSVIGLHRQKQAYDRQNLKIFYHGLLLDRPEHHQIDLTGPDSIMNCMAKNTFRLAEQLPLYDSLVYGAIERIQPKLQANFWRRFTNLRSISVTSQIKDHQQFLGFLAKFDNVVALEFYFQPQSADLFDQLSEYCGSVQHLRVIVRDLNLDFVFKLRNLVRFVCLNVDEPSFVRRMFAGELEFVRYFAFEFRGTDFIVKRKPTNHFTLNVDFQDEDRHFGSLDDVLEHIRAAEAS